MDAASLTVFLRPRAGLLVRDPVTKQPLPPEGASKPLTPYWRRRIQDGDVDRIERPQKTKQTKPKRASAQE